MKHLERERERKERASERASERGDLDEALKEDGIPDKQRDGLQPLVLPHLPAHPPLRQYLYFCTSKASKVRTWERKACTCSASCSDTAARTCSARSTLSPHTLVP
jgi:hypothetical protein